MAQFVELYRRPGTACIPRSGRDGDGPRNTGSRDCGEWLTRLARARLHQVSGRQSPVTATTHLGQFLQAPSRPTCPVKSNGLRRRWSACCRHGTSWFVTESGISYPDGAQYTAGLSAPRRAQRSMRKPSAHPLCHVGRGRRHSSCSIRVGFPSSVASHVLQPEQGEVNFNSPHRPKAACALRCGDLRD